MADYRKENQVLRVARYFAKNPATGFSIAYVLLTLCGIYYSFTFFAEFDVPILKLADISDVMIAGIGEPAALLMFSGGVFIAILTDYITRKSYDGQAKWRKKPPSVKRTLMLIALYTPKRREEALAFMLGTFVLYSFIFVFWYSDWKAEQVKEGKGINILISTESGPQPTSMLLLGSTTNFVVAYDMESEKANIIPIDKLEYIQPVKPILKD